MFYVYVLQSLKDGGFYTGYSDDLKRRFATAAQRQHYTGTPPLQRRCNERISVDATISSAGETGELA
jgi:hypothetical protein